MTLKFNRMSWWAQGISSVFLVPAVIPILLSCLVLLVCCVPIFGVAMLDGGKAFEDDK